MKCLQCFHVNTEKTSTIRIRFTVANYKKRINRHRFNLIDKLSQLKNVEVKRTNNLFK